MAQAARIPPFFWAVSRIVAVRCPPKEAAWEMPVDSCQLEPALDKPGIGVCRCAASARERYGRAAGLSELHVATPGRGKRYAAFKDRLASKGHLAVTSIAVDMHRSGGLVDERWQSCGR